MTHSKVNHSRSAGTLMIIPNSIWLYTGIERLYGQNFGGRLYIFMYPNWLLVIATLCAVAGITLGVYVLKERIKIKYGILINITLFSIYIFMELVLTS